jgi:hypothetical protein
VLQINQGSLYPALHRLEHQGWIEVEWAVSELGRRAKYYQLTPSGRRQLAVEAGEWERMSTAIGRVMKLARQDESARSVPADSRAGGSAPAPDRGIEMARPASPRVQRRNDEGQIVVLLGAGAPGPDPLCQRRRNLSGWRIDHRPE